MNKEEKELQEIKNYIMSTDIMLLDRKNINYPEYNDVIEKLIELKEIKEDIIVVEKLYNKNHKQEMKDEIRDLEKQYNRVNSTLPCFLQENIL